MPNRLENSSSAYLKSAAHQPIDWHEFGPEAFDKAKAEDKPVLLDIGAVWCHWCHVIDRESYDNAEIAGLINQHYIPVKVDRDQRPDVDARYQQVVQATTGQGGWPLTAFLTYDGRLIYGGTYFPPQAMKSLLERIHQVYHERKTEIFGGHDVLSEDNIRRLEAADRAGRGQTLPTEEVSSVALKKLCSDFLDHTLATVKRMVDPIHGGFGSQPKFPHFSTLALMINHIHRDDEAREFTGMLEKTLTEMARGGIYDQIAGGFHRYSVDDHWHVPHFEKMAYDNAEALKVYAEAYRLTGIPLYREIAENIIRWTGETLADPGHGGFYASQDADIDLEDDGDYFTWSPDELREILSPQEIEVVSRFYDITAAGDMHHAAGRNVLYVSRPLTHIARELGLPNDTAEALLNAAQDKMREKRLTRPTPFIDRTLYANWNGMQIAAWFEAADLLDLPDTRTFAEKSLDRVLTLLYEPGRVLFHAEGIEGFLEDYAWMALAALKGYQSTEERRYFDVARDLADMMLERFEDRQAGGFFDTIQNPEALGLLKVRRKPAEDSPSSSANAIALQVLTILAYTTGNTRYLASLERGLNLLIHLSGQAGLFVAALGQVACWYLEPPLKLEVLGHTHELKAAARQVCFPGKIVTYHPEEPEAQIRICVGTQCLAPVTDAASLSEQIQTLTNPGVQV